ncbi:MAG: hypothetical protein KAI97_09670 [Gemmatimonadetes bacterium]|nr:hypothetical protein [Gemmatimonadota bacterium]
MQSQRVAAPPVSNGLGQTATTPDAFEGLAHHVKPVEARLGQEERLPRMFVVLVMVEKHHRVIFEDSLAYHARHEIVRREGIHMDPHPRKPRKIDGVIGDVADGDGPDLQRQ